MTQPQAITQMQMMNNPMLLQPPAQLSWVQFGKADFDKTVRDLEGTLIAFKIYLDIRVNVEGRGHTF